jgi:cyclic pyranopterin phosphate synthase
MPEKVKFVGREQLMSYEEIIRTISVFRDFELKKLRFTGGEPFMRRDFDGFLENIAQRFPSLELHLTTNGILMKGKAFFLKKIGVQSVNLSLDTLKRERFHEMTRRDAFDQVMDAASEIMEAGLNLKVNTVLMKAFNEDELVDIVEWTKDNHLSVRFIEEMPFNGGDHVHRAPVDYEQILEQLKRHYGKFLTLENPSHSTSYNFRIPGYKGSFGVIPAWSRTICSSCNRIRLTPQGIIKNCLYDQGIFDLKALMRNGATDEQIKWSIEQAVKAKKKNGFETEKAQRRSGTYESMAKIGG